MIPLLLSLLFLGACDPRASYKKRLKKAAEKKGDIVIGIVDSSNAPSLFNEGVRMAVEEINRKGGISGRLLKPHFYDDEGSPVKGGAIARKLAADTELVAVIGHRFSDVAVPVSITYEENGIVFISTGATDQDLIRDGNQFIFRNIPSDDAIGRNIAEFAKRNAYNEIAVIYDSESSGRRISEIFHEYADNLGIRIIAEKAYSGWQNDFRPLISELIQTTEKQMRERVLKTVRKVEILTDGTEKQVRELKKKSEEDIRKLKEKTGKKDVYEHNVLQDEIRKLRDEMQKEAARTIWNHQKIIRKLIRETMKNPDTLFPGQIPEDTEVIAIQIAELKKWIDAELTELFRWGDRIDSRFNAVFLGGILPSAAQMILQLRDMGVSVPILTNELLDSTELLNIAGKNAQGTIISTVFDPKQVSTTTRNFVREFKKHSELEPDTWAAQGYDAVRVLAHAMEESGSSDPMVVSTSLGLIREWDGVAGSYSFESKGNIVGKSVFFKEVQGGAFKQLERDRQLSKDIDPFQILEDITLRIPIEEVITTIDPGLSVDVTSFEIIEQLFLGLTDFDPQSYEAVPELAKNWNVSQDGTIYRFNLRDDVVWSDGTPVTAHDVVWAVRRNIRPETKSPYAYVMNVIRNAGPISKGEIRDANEMGVKALDDYTVEFELEHPAAYFPGMVGLGVFRPLPRDAILRYGEKWTEPGNIQGNASYLLKEWKKGMMMILRKNPDYFEADKVSIPEVRYYVIPESSVGLAMYESGQFDILGESYLPLPLDDIPRIMSSPVLSAELSQQPSFCNYAYAFNTTLFPVNDPLVRKAISAAIDRKLLIRMITKGSHEPATTYTRPPVFGAVESKEKIGIRFDPAQAQEWLAEAGFPDGDGFPAITLLYNYSLLHDKVAKAIQTFLKHYLNIKVHLMPKNWDDYMRMIRQPNSPHIFRYGWCSDYPDANNWLNELFHPERSSNVLGWNNAEFAELMDKAERETIPSERKEMYQRAEQILCEEECAVVPVYFENGNFLVKPRVKGWYNMAMGGQHIRNWRLEE